MDSLNKYFSLMQERPDLFRNLNEPGEIKIIHDPERIRAEQKRIQDELRAQGKPEHYIEIGVLLEDPWVWVVRDMVEFPDGKVSGYIRLYNRAYLKGGAAGVVMLPEKDGKILLMHNFRHVTRAWHWEIPRGFGEPVVSAEDQARVELKEEIGVEVDELVDLGLYFNNTGLEGNPITLFVARITQEPVPNSEISVDQLRWASVEELEGMIANEEITDGFTIAAYTRAKLNGLI